MTLRIATATIQFVYNDAEQADPRDWPWDALLDCPVQARLITVDRAVDPAPVSGYYAIVNTAETDDFVESNDPHKKLLWWSNLYGWCSFEQASFFTENQTNGFFLPQDGAWILL